LSDRLSLARLLPAIVRPRRFGRRTLYLDPKKRHECRMDDRDKRLSAAVTILREELARTGGANRDVMQRLFDLLLTPPGSVFRRDPLAKADRPLIDMRVARVLAAVRERQSERWTIARMAKLAGMSRAAFTRLTGKPPVLFRRIARGQIAPIVGKAMLRLAA